MQKYMSHSKNKYIKKCLSWCSLYWSSRFLVNLKEIRIFMALNVHCYIISRKSSQNIRLKMSPCQSEQVKKVSHYRFNVHFFDFSWGWMILNVFID